MSFDLSSPSLAETSEQGHEHELLTPQGEPTGTIIIVRGPEADAVRQCLRRQLADAQARELAAKRRGKDPEALTIEQLEAQAIELAVAYTAGWRKMLDGGKPVEFSVDAARRLYQRHSWARRQVIEAAQDLGNFVRVSSSSCSSTPAQSGAST